MYTLPKSKNPLYADPEEKYVLNMDTNEEAASLLEKLPSLTVLYEARNHLVEKIVERIAMERDFYHEGGSVPDYVIRNVAWKSSGEFVRMVTEAIANDPNIQNNF